MAYRVVIQQPITDLGINFLKDKGYDVFIGDGKTDVETMKKAVRGADALLIRTAPYTREILECAENLKVVGRQGVGLDNVDLDYCREKGIWVTIAPQANSNAVAEHTIGMIAASAHHIVYMDKMTREGNWEVRNLRKGRDISGKTLGLIGLGRIGKMVAEKAALGLGMNVIGYDQYLTDDQYPSIIIPAENIDEILKKADYLSLHIPATKETKNMVDKEFLSKMKNTAVLINCARGEIVDEEALYDALKNGVIAGAACDVLKDEPPKLENPLLTLDNIIFTPHNATLTYETMDAMGLHAAMGIDDVLNGRKPQWPAISID